MNNYTLPPRNEWKNLSISQLYEIKSRMTGMFYDMRSINASFASQYAGFISEIDDLIHVRESGMEAQD
jgi:hypothetical protein